MSKIENIDNGESSRPDLKGQSEVKFILSFFILGYFAVFQYFIYTYSYSLNGIFYQSTLVFYLFLNY